MDYSCLISGSDLRGVAQSAGAGEGLTPEAAASAAMAFARFLSEKEGVPAGEITVAVGHDPRLSSQALRRAVLAGLSAAGVMPLDCALSTTPAMFMATRIGPRVNASVMITASHLPPDRNGLKFITREGGLSHEDIAAIVSDMRTYEGSLDGSAPARGFLPEYAAFLRSVVKEACGDDKPLMGMKIVVDASSGSGGFFAWDVLEPLGADIAGSVNLEADGRFPAHSPNPIEPAVMEYAGRAVAEADADMGLLFDADCDRLTVIDRGGAPIGRNRLVALAAAVELRKQPGAVVTDSLTCPGVTDFIEALGGRHERFKCGYKNVIDRAKALNAAGEYCPLAIETSGHCAFKGNYFLDDGAYLAARLVCEAAAMKRQGTGLYGLIASLKEQKEAREKRYSLTGDVNARANAMLEAVRAAMGASDAYAEQYTAEGVRFNRLADGAVTGWFILRKSVHDPVMVLNAESDEEGGAAVIIASVEAVLSGV